MDLTFGHVTIFDDPPSRSGSGTLSLQAAVAELGQAALLSPDVNSIFEMAADLLLRVLAVDYVKVLHQPSAGKPLILMAGSGWQDHVRVGETTVPCDLDSQAGYTLLSNEPVFVEDLAKETRFTGPKLLRDHDVRSGMSVAIQGREGPYGVLGVHTLRKRRFTVEESDFLRSVANILGSAVVSKRFVEQVERRARYETAIAECAQALLASTGDDRIERALNALLTATEAVWVFLERNVVDPELGFCSRTVAEVEAPGTPTKELESGYWDLVPWERMPTSREHLEQGRPFVVIPEELDGPEYDLYAADPYPVKSELDIPIFVDGEWAGLIGFGDQSEVRDWSRTDLSLLTAAAQMIGAFWEREAARERLEQLNRAKDEFLASVSHELRTPLAAVVGFGQILRDGAHALSDGERAELVETLVAQGMDLTNITNDLLVAAKADMGTLEVSSVPVNLRAQTSQVLEAIERNRALGVELVGPPVRAIGDPDRVRQIVRNLVSNAIRYGGEAIRIEVTGGDATAKLLVCDDGSPIPTEDRERIFEPYQRAHDYPGVTDSLGLGLAISRQLARLMGGDLTYRHQDGESIFEITLPSAAPNGTQ